MTAKGRLELFRRGAADGTLRRHIPGEMLLEIYAGLGQTFLHLWARDQLEVEPASATIVTVFLSGALDNPASGR